METTRVIVVIVIIVTIVTTLARARDVDSRRLTTEWLDERCG
jgi:hypothetical protein